MRITTIISTGLSLFALSTAAHASVNVASSDYGFDETPASTITFDAALPLGFTLTGGMVRNFSDGYGAEPAIAPGVRDTTNYLTANSGDDATIMGTSGYKKLSFYWGSIDTYNTVSLLAQDGSVIQSFGGMDIHLPANGDQGADVTNREVSFSVDGDTPLIYGVRFASTSPAMEVDNVLFSNAVPEPATWAMMIGGIGIAGAAMRRRSASGQQGLGTAIA